MEIILSFFSAYGLILILYSALEKSHNILYWKVIWLMVTSTIFLLSATRVGGSDWENYNYLYFYMSNAETWFEAIEQNLLVEPGYVLLNYFLRILSDDRRWLVVFESVINAYAVWLILSRVKGGPLLLVFLFPIQFANILGVRQTLATSLFIIAVTTFRGRVSVAAQVTSSLIHASSLLLVFGRAMQIKRLSWRGAWIGLTLVLFFFFCAREFFAEKLSNYIENAAELTGVSGVEIFFGKGLTIAFLFAIDRFAHAQLPTHTETVGVIKESSSILFILYAAFLVAAISIPPLTRILGPLELLIAWGVCGDIINIRRRRTRTLLAIIIVAFSMAKMLKIWSQFNEVYSVCFFCY